MIDHFVSPEQVQIGARIREARKVKGLTQAAVCQQVGISKSFYCEVEHGAEISASRLLRIASILGVSVDYLLTGKAASSIAVPLGEFMPISEDWLRECRFRWRQEERQPSKHWTLWLGMPRFMGSCEDIGIELAAVGRDAEWFCWLRSDSSHRYERFIHVRHLTTQGEVMALVAAITGQAWNPENHRYGHVCTPEQIERFDAEDERLQIRLRRTGAIEGIGVDPEPGNMGLL